MLSETRLLPGPEVGPGAIGALESPDLKGDIA